MKLPTITPKQQALIRLIYRYRFLERRQLQTLLGHKDKRRISAWLKELRERKIINWFYETDGAEKSKPAIYFMYLGGIQLLRRLGNFPEKELRKRYKEASKQSDFINRCLLIADCCLHLEDRNNGEDEVAYAYALDADYADPDKDFYFLIESEFIRPSLAFTKEAETDNEFRRQTYFLEVIDPTTPRYMVKKKLRDYVDYLDSEEWDQQESDEAMPIILIACPTIAELIYAKRHARKLLDDYELQDREGVQIRFATTEKIRRHGLTGLIWEEV
jgi:hypothetical protein